LVLTLIANDGSNNALAELTHKRRLSCLGQWYSKRLQIWLSVEFMQLIGRICPIETPEGKNAGLVNSITIYANLNQNGLLKPHSGKYIRA
jgi:DNA-directed RNA polymerase subunit beta